MLARWHCIKRISRRESSFPLMRGLEKKETTLQTHHVDSILKGRGNGRFHVVSTWNPLGVFVGFLVLR